MFGLKDIAVHKTKHVSLCRDDFSASQGKSLTQNLRKGVGLRAKYGPAVFDVRDIRHSFKHQTPFQLFGKI